MLKKTHFFTALLITLLSISTSFASGTPNLDGSGSGLTPNGSSQNFWNSGNEGVRITVVHEASQTPVTTPIDLSNRSISDGVEHFGKVCKLHYRSGQSLTLSTQSYQVLQPDISIPSVIQSNGSINITALRYYFGSEYMARLMARQTGMDYDILIGGEYVLLVEPIAYVTYAGSQMALTATEVALYDPLTNNTFYYWLRTLSHRNLPLSLYLETPQLGFSAASGSVRLYSNSEIFANLGIGVVSYADGPLVTPTDYVYRTDTEVITSVTISGGQSDPDNPTSVTFSIDGTRYSVGNVYYPDGGSQVAWVKWRTPSDPQTISISVSASGSGSPNQSFITCQIEDLDENPPPNPAPQGHFLRRPIKLRYARFLGASGQCRRPKR